MKENTGVIAFFNRLLYAGTFSVVMLYCIFDLLDISDVNWKHIAVLLVTSAILSASRLLNRRQRIYMATLGFLAFLFLFFSIGSDRWLLYFGELGRVFLLAAVCFSVQIFLGKNIFLKMVSADIVGGWLIYMRKVPKMGVVFFILYTGLIVAEWIRERHQRMKHGNAQAYILGILPFLLVYAVFLCFMPMPDKPYDWQWVKNIYRSVENKITMYTENLWHSGNEYFDGAAAGFSGEGDLSGSITENHTRLMTLRIGSHKDVSVYLTGKVFDSFNGREWENRWEGDDVWNDDRGGIRDDINGFEKIMDVMETVYALGRYTGNPNSRYNSSKMDVSYQYFHTNYLMAPSKTWGIENKDKKINCHYNGGNFLFDKKAGYGTEYTLWFYQLDMEREELYRFLDWNQGEDAIEWAKVVGQYTDEDIPIEELHVYREVMKELYFTQTSVSLEMEEWIASVTADAKTDIEKLKMIESTLAGMGYHTNPGKLPETVTDESSFLDYFILEKREGYCVHFATAFVLLARAEGFPARYVQGFCVPVVSGDDIPVYSDMAHAWPEVYIEGKGWIPFEPTPGFGVNRYLPGQENEDGGISTAPAIKPGFQMQDDISEPDTEMSDDNTRKERVLPYLINVVLIVVIGGIFVFAIDFVWEKYR